MNGQKGCCPNGKICTSIGGGGQCANSAYVRCPNEDFCCRMYHPPSPVASSTRSCSLPLSPIIAPGYHCFRDSANVRKCSLTSITTTKPPPPPPIKLLLHLPHLQPRLRLKLRPPRAQNRRARQRVTMVITMTIPVTVQMAQTITVQTTTARAITVLVTTVLVTTAQATTVQATTVRATAVRMTTVRTARTPIPPARVRVRPPPFRPHRLPTPSSAVRRIGKVLWLSTVLLRSSF